MSLMVSWQPTQKHFLYFKMCVVFFHFKSRHQYFFSAAKVLSVPAKIISFFSNHCYLFSLSSSSRWNRTAPERLPVLDQKPHAVQVKPFTPML